VTSLLDDVHVVLLRPERAGNLGSVARAMKNFGLRRLTIVDSRMGSWNDAWQMAVHADDVLRSAVEVGALATAIADAQWVVGTTTRPPAGMALLTPREIAAATAERGPPTLLFGGEPSGLTAAELLHCHTASTIPVADAQPSLNLAQAVCVYAAELFVAHGAASPRALLPPAVPMADPNLMYRLEVALTHLLEATAWRDASRPDNAIAELMQPFFRARLTEREVRAWLVAVNKAGQR
jgi:TrmH family RNA methyltransferase